MTAVQSLETRLDEGRRRAASGDAAGAFGLFRDIVRTAPDCAEAWTEMSGILMARGDEGAATQALSHGMAAGNSAGRRRLARPLAQRLSGLRPRDWHGPLDRDLLAVLAEDEVDHQSLARVTALTLLAKPATADPAEQAITAIATDPLWLAFLTQCLNVDAAMEARLIEIRRALLDRSGRDGPGKDVMALVCAVAVQASAGERIWAVEESAVERLDDLGRSAAAVAVRAMYAPLPASELTPDVIEGLRATGTGFGALLIRRVVDEPLREAVLAAAVPALAAEASGDAISARVRLQYEASPYPRWRSLPHPQGRALAGVIADLPKVDRGRAPKGPLRLLIAGCGTGYEAIDLARMDPTLAIAAIDLSRRSLGYAARMAEAAGVETVAFRQGDILDLEGSGLSFDAAISTGVLHHMDDPAAGLRAICSVLAAGGVVRIAVYAERARAAVMAAHRLIDAEGLKPDLAGIRGLRAAVFASDPASPLVQLSTSDDFYSASGCRDLVFHVHERRFTLPELGDLLSGAGLTLAGFDALPEALALFRQTFGAQADTTDFVLWDRLEATHPTLFAGMYAVWGQKAGRA